MQHKQKMHYLHIAIDYEGRKSAAGRGSKVHWAQSMRLLCIIHKKSRDVAHSSARRRKLHKSDHFQQPFLALSVYKFIAQHKSFLRVARETSVYVHSLLFKGLVCAPGIINQCCCTKVEALCCLCCFVYIFDFCERKYIPGRPPCTPAGMHFIMAMIMVILSAPFLSRALNLYSQSHTPEVGTTEFVTKLFIQKPQCSSRQSELFFFGHALFMFASC
jgi:hypothetical protein